jgi:hypothetical protein
MASLKFTARVESVAPGQSAAWVSLDLPRDVSRKLPSRGTVPIAGTIQGFPFRTSVMPDGKGGHSMMVNKAMREGGKVGPGDEVTVVFVVDTASREPEVPADLGKAIAASAKAKATWTDITPRARGEWVEHVTAAKRPETRVRRIAKTVERLAKGDRRVYD